MQQSLANSKVEEPQPLPHLTEEEVLAAGETAGRVAKHALSISDCDVERDQPSSAGQRSAGIAKKTQTHSASCCTPPCKIF